MPNKDSDRAGTFADVLCLALTSWRALFRALALIVLSSLSLVTILLLSFRLWRWMEPSLAVRVEPSGAVVLTSEQARKTAMFLLSANGGNDSPWINTEVDINEGQTFKITASGKVCLAIHRLVQSAENDIPPPLPWIGPEGLDLAATYPPRSSRTQEREAVNHVIAPHLRQGRLIGVVSRERPLAAPKEVLDIGQVNSFKATRSGTLWLAINEIWLDRSKEFAYVADGRQGTNDFRQKILDRQYWNVWYDDNAGSFLVAIEISPIDGQK